MSTNVGANVFADASAILPIDWLAESPAIVDQGSCGTCWAFATSAGIEIQNQITNPSSSPLKFSEQLIVDCNPWRWGCSGGTTSVVVKNWMAPSQVKVALASVYPYVARRNKCNTTITRQQYVPTAQIDYLYSSTNGTSAAYSAALQTGPVVVRVRADTSYWQGYKSGVLNNTACFGTGSWNHAVVIVGQGVDGASSLPYWLVRNSWGSSWGENGYIKLAITESGYGVCGQQYHGWSITMKDLP